MTAPVPPLARPFMGLIRCYQRWISPALPPCCRFAPTCSDYAWEALRVHGVFKGMLLTLWRLARCAPWHPGGVDPVPNRFGFRSRTRVSRAESAATVRPR